MRLLTVATANYIYWADVMFSHSRRIHPELRPTLLVADVSRAALDPVREMLDPDVDVLCCDDLGFDFLADMRTYYGPLEFCSALKVLGLSYVLRNEDACLFLDPDMVVHASLREAVFDQPGEIVVSSHTMAPYPHDGALPDDLEPCLAGHINGGVFFARREQSGTPAIDWLIEKTRYEWFVAPDIGMYADQQWLSALPYFFRDRTTIVSDRGVNVAYWNLHERPLFEKDGRINLASGEPLRLMHFSGFMAPSGGKLTKHSNRQFDAGTEAALIQLIQSYETELISARARLGYLRGDIQFCNHPLPVRLRRAANRWNAPHLVRQTLIQRLRRALRTRIKWARERT